ncbi:aspartate-semialdehyde dehydrogenase [Eisenibacter elegans]|jgi:aspartate-semialdehyde dehydrogenase|uniref:aspartate-semialdehyde dehydrogenase n=1 Tax=Eisenibacter elegans TaxID=997 RepID=UPI0004031751|nr:aspartate-semialdehyde dehydrogenase [Eisenibacter elegans]
MKLALVGATGLVGREMLKVLEERNFPVSTLIPVASERSVGSQIIFKGQPYTVCSMDDAIAQRPDIALFSAGGSTSLAFAPKFAEVGTTVIDNSSAWRMHPDHKLIVPEVNAHVLTKGDKIIANPNCSTIQMVVALKGLHERYKVERIVVSTYQSVTGTGKNAVEQLMNERAGIDGPKAYPYTIDLNILPHIDVFLENGYTKEEMKMILETKKIMGDDSIRVTATTVRVPVIGGHSESLNVEFAQDFEMVDVYEILCNAPGVIVKDDPQQLEYPMPLDAHGNDAVWVGRIRRDESQPRTLNMWVVSDNLRKGAATNAVQIAEYLRAQNLV